MGQTYQLLGDQAIFIEVSKLIMDCFSFVLPHYVCVISPEN